MVERLLVVGNPRSMEAVREMAASHAREVFVLPSLFEVRSRIPAADLILVFQQHPDEFTPREILALIEEYPLTRMVVCQGPWCASYGRTREGWPPAVCVPHDQAIARLQREMAILAGERPPLPLTAGLDEIFAFDHDL